MIAIDKTFNTEWVVGVLHQICSALISKGNAVSRGDVLGPHGQLHSTTTMTALYATRPFFLEENHMTLELNGLSRTIAWLIPIYTSEVMLIEQSGWQALEDELEPNIGVLPRLDRPVVV